MQSNGGTTHPAARSMDAPPAISSRHTGGSSTARGTLLTVLGEFVLPGSGNAWTAAFLDVFSRIGIEPNTTRQALMRSASDGWLTRERVGRRTRWHLTADAVDMLSAGSQRIHEFAARQNDWDGRWVLVIARAPESDRAARHTVRTRLASAGFGVVSPGVWLSTHVDRLGDARSALAHSGLLSEAVVLNGRVVAGQELPQLVSRAWDLDALRRQYEIFTTEFSKSDTDDPLRRLLELVHAWRRFPWTDPALPDALLPDAWPGANAASLFADRYGRWAGDARLIWAEVAG